MAEILTPEKQNGKVFQKKKLIRVDMTPMVDLGFLLITFFMLATSFSKPNVMDLSLPAGENLQGNVINFKNQITFLIGKDNRIFYYQAEKKDLNSELLKETSFTDDDITKVIESARKNAPKPELFTVIIKPTEDANYKNFVDILDEMQLTNSERYGISEISDTEKKVYQEKVK